MAGTDDGVFCSDGEEDVNGSCKVVADVRKKKAPIV
jgi:hypothetical protein